MGVSKLRPTVRTLPACVKAAAKSSSNVVMIPPPDEKSMGGKMTYLQALACLREGTIIGEPKLNEHGHFEFTMERFAANYLFRLRVIAECAGATVSKLYAILPDDNI